MMIARLRPRNGASECEWARWRDAIRRSREPWTPAEERQLLAIYRDPNLTATWCGTKRRHPMYAAAVALHRTPSACQGRYQELQRCKRRKRCA